MVAGLSPKRGRAQVTILTLKCETDVAKLGGFAPEILDRSVLRLDENDRGLKNAARWIKAGSDIKI